MKFIADIMVGKLARYLRMAGYDVIYLNDIEDAEVLRIAKKESRTILTRDVLMLQSTRGLGLFEKTLNRLGIVGVLGRQRLDGHLFA